MAEDRETLLVPLWSKAGLTRKDVEPYNGSRAWVSEVLNRRRPLTLAMIRRLRDGLGIPADILVAPLEQR